MLLRFAMIGRGTQDFRLHSDTYMVARQDTLTEISLPVVVIVGRPNVGKSTLFNAIIGQRRSIVGDEPGITRDRIQGEASYLGRRFDLIDTGGIIPNDAEMIPTEILKQARVALDQAAQIIFLIDGRTEITGTDRDLAKVLRKLGKPVTLAVNKIDATVREGLAHEFHSLGFKDLFPISSEHRIGFDELLDHVTKNFSSDEGPEEPQPEKRAIKVAIIGRPNVGKSTLLNALVGQERAIVSPVAGTTRDAVDQSLVHAGVEYVFVDTAGIRRKGKTKLMAEKLSVIMAPEHLEAADVSLLVIDATEGVTALDANIGGEAHESGRSVIIVVNKGDLMTRTGRDGMRLFDGKPPADQKLYEQDVRDKLKYLDYAPLLFISAADGKNIEQVFKKVELVARERRKRVTTGQMNRFLEKVDFQKASVPMNKRVRIYYMTQAAVAPPTFVLFTDKDVKMHFSFERFLGNQIRENFGFIGSPIWFKIKARNKKKDA